MDISLEDQSKPSARLLITWIFVDFVAAVLHNQGEEMQEENLADMYTKLYGSKRDMEEKERLLHVLTQRFDTHF